MVLIGLPIAIIDGGTVPDRLLQIETSAQTFATSVIHHSSMLLLKAPLASRRLPDIGHGTRST